MINYFSLLDQVDDKNELFSFLAIEQYESFKLDIEKFSLIKETFFDTDEVEGFGSKIIAVKRDISKKTFLKGYGIPLIQEAKYFYQNMNKLFSDILEISEEIDSEVLKVHEEFNVRFMDKKKIINSIEKKLNDSFLGD